AEDGIRDLTVTGVQTCALPIYADDALAGPDVAADRVQLRLRQEPATDADDRDVRIVQDVQAGQFVPVGLGAEDVVDAVVPGQVRSEERRVGKEGRSRWGRDQ